MSRRSRFTLLLLLLLSCVASPPQADPVTSSLPGPVFGVNDGSDYDRGLAFNVRVTARVQRLGLTAARMSVDGSGCVRTGQPGDFTGTDLTVSKHLKRGTAPHLGLFFRDELEMGNSAATWTHNHAWKCGQFAEHSRVWVSDDSVDNEPDISYDPGQPGAVSPELMVTV